MAKLMRIDLFNRAQLPNNHWDCALSGIPDDLKHKQIVTDYVEDIRDNIDQGKGVYWWGTYGSGKTGIAAIVVKAALSKGYMPLWISAESIPSYMCDDIYFDDGTLMRDRLFEVPLLIIDDVRLRDQTSLRSDWIERWLEAVVRRRMDNTLSTHITSNNSPYELKKLKAMYAICTEAMAFVEVKGINFRELDGKKK